MNSKVEKHVKSVLKNYDISEDYKDELITSCQEEYSRAIEHGYDPNAAFNMAVKDFDAEFPNKAIERNWKIANACYFLAALIAILIFFFAVQKGSDLSILVLFIPGCVILLVRISSSMVFSLTQKNYKILKLDIQTAVLIFLLYAPSIVVEFLRKDTLTFSTYMIYSSFILLPISIYIMWKNRKASDYLFILLIALVLVSIIWDISSKYYGYAMVWLFALINLLLIVQNVKNKKNFVHYSISLLIFVLLPLNISSEDLMVTILSITVSCTIFLACLFTRKYNLYPYVNVFFLAVCLEELYHMTYLVLDIPTFPNFSDKLLPSLTGYLLLMLLQNVLQNIKRKEERK